MKNHFSFPKTSKNKLIAQEAGINAALNSYKHGLYHQGIMFSWDDEPIGLNIMLDNLTYRYMYNPKNIEELRSIAKDACLIEFENLKKNHVGDLPIAVFDDESVISFLVESSTNVIKLSLPIDFFDSLIDKNIDNVDVVWKDEFVKEYSIDKVKQYALDIFNEKLSNKRITLPIQEAALFEINEYWSKINDIEEIINSYP